MTEDMALRAANLYAAGDSFGKIGEELSISKSRVGDLIRKGIFDLANHDIEPDEAPDESPSVQLEDEQENDEPGFDYDAPTLDAALGKTFIAQASPILRKVALNPKVFLFHDYAKASLGYQGDIGDFLVEAVEYFWKSQGFKITISHDEMI